MKVELALRKRDTRVTARFIRWWTSSQYSHCELVIDGWCYSSSAMDGGVRKKRIDLRPEHWDIMPLPGASAQAVQEYFIDTMHKRYGWVGLIVGQMFNLNRAGPESAEFCSQWCAAALGLPNAASLSPATLHRWLVYIYDVLGRSTNCSEAASTMASASARAS